MLWEGSWLTVADQFYNFLPNIWTSIIQGTMNEQWNNFSSFVESRDNCKRRMSSGDEKSENLGFNVHFRQQNHSQWKPYKVKSVMMRDLYIWEILLHWIFRSIPRQFILNQFDKGLFYEGWMDIVWASFLHRINKMQDLTQEQELTVSFDSQKPYHKSLCLSNAPCPCVQSLF